MKKNYNKSNSGFVQISYVTFNFRSISYTFQAIIVVDYTHSFFLFFYGKQANHSQR